MENKAETIVSVVGLLGIALIIFFGIMPSIKETNEYNSLPKETWTEINSSFELNGKKCNTYIIYNGIRNKKWESHRVYAGRFVRCDGDSTPSNMEEFGKTGWK